MTGPRRAAIAAAIWTLCVPAGAAALENSEASPPTELLFVRARAVRASLIELAPEARFLLVVLADPVATAAWDVAPEFSPFIASTQAPACRQIFALVAFPGPTIAAPAITALIGQSFDVAVLPPASPAEWCEARVGHAHLWPGGAYFDDRRWEPHGKRHKDAILPALQAVRDVFVPDGAAEATPLDRLIVDALGGLESRAGFELALRNRLYFGARGHVRWPHDASLFPVIAADLLERPWKTTVPDPSQVELFWHLSPTRARAAVLELAAHDPDKATSILHMSPARPEALATLRELYEAGTVKRLYPSRELLRAGVFPELIERAAASTVDEREARELREAGALAATRAALGVTDGPSLVRLVAARPGSYDVERPFLGMQVSLTGASQYCCRLLFPISDTVTLHADVDCDAESFRRACDQPSGALLEVTGRVVSARAQTRDKDGVASVTVDLKLADASAVPVAAAPTSSPGSPMKDVAPRGQVTTAGQAAAPVPATSGGCGCDLGGRSGGAWWLAMLLAAGRRRRAPVPRGERDPAVLCRRRVESR